MATIDYKQKIKDYMNSSEVDTLYKSMLSNLFPELKESKEEGIRQLLISFVKYDMPDNYSDDFSKEDCLTWLEKKGENGAKGNEREIPNSAWSDEDERLLSKLQTYVDIECFDRECNGQDLIDWLKSLRERVQPKIELTQLDKNILEAAIAFVEQNDHFNCCRGVDKHTVLSALRSLSTKNTWKPSLAQLNALSIVSKGYIPDDVDGIVSLYNDLKKIWEE